MVSHVVVGLPAVWAETVLRNSYGLGDLRLAAGG